MEIVNITFSSSTKQANSSKRILNWVMVVRLHHKVVEIF